MSSICQTAYPRFKHELTQRKFEEVNAPCSEDSKFIRCNAKTPAAKLYLVLLLKTVLRLGYLPILREIPAPKQVLADIINVIVEELVRQRFESPIFSLLNRKALTVRSEVKNHYFKTLPDPLPPAVIDQYYAMFIPTSQQAVSRWQQLKQYPQKPTNARVRRYLEHLQWLKS